jgi:HPt (histidine-containing phosphotransfer) domain-containing protein
MEELLELFTSECELKLHEIAVALGSGMGAADQASKQAHAIAGSSANIGAKQLWRVAKQLEAQCKDGSMAAAEATFEQLKADYMATVEILRQIVGGLEGA